MTLTMANPEVEALANLAAQLSVKRNDANEENAAPSTTTMDLMTCQDDEECDFSSFPSLSLEESPGNYHTGSFTSRGDVESHVESLLSRPILLGKQQQQQQQQDEDSNKSGLESDSLDEFFVERLQDVPTQMVSNFCSSFSTLMNSRLRAYASFLARHGQSLARCSKTNQQLVGIEHKLETMLWIGSQVSVGQKSSELTIDQEKLPKELSTEDDDGETYKLSLPLRLQINVDIALPHVRKVDGEESMNLSFQTTGKICGIFAKPANSSQASAILRVAEVSLNMHGLLTAMADQASKVISGIVDMTNAVQAVVPLPGATEEPKGRRPSVVEPDTTTTTRRNKRKVDFAVADEDAIVALSPERCATIVDCVIGELDDILLMLPPHSAKKIKGSAA